MIGPDSNPSIFCSEMAFGPEEIIHPSVSTPLTVSSGRKVLTTMAHDNKTVVCARE